MATLGTGGNVIRESLIVDNPRSGKPGVGGGIDQWHWHAMTITNSTIARNLVKGISNFSAGG